jgi:hypothetical protein
MKFALMISVSTDIINYVSFDFDLLRVLFGQRSKMTISYT